MQDTIYHAPVLQLQMIHEKLIKNTYDIMKYIWPKQKIRVQIKRHRKAIIAKKQSKQQTPYKKVLSHTKESYQDDHSQISMKPYNKPNALEKDNIMQVAMQKHLLPFPQSLQSTLKRRNKQNTGISITFYSVWPLKSQCTNVLTKH